MQLWLIPLLPLAGFALNGLFGRRLSKTVINGIAAGSVLLSFLWVLKTLSALGVFSGGLTGDPYKEHYYTWIQSGALNISVDFAIDRLTAVWLMIVTGVGFLIHVYAIGYMAHEGGYYRFFAYLNLFMFFMLVLVLGANYLLLFVGWEGVGLCSYLLVGFYFLEKFATDAGNKALQRYSRKLKVCRSSLAWAGSRRYRCCCCWAPLVNPRNFLFTCGCRTRWPDPLPSAP
jgi:NADH-quinone oxidoreductase subunit L